MPKIAKSKLYILVPAATVKRPLHIGLRMPIMPGKSQSIDEATYKRVKGSIGFVSLTTATDSRPALVNVIFPVDKE